MLTKIYDLCVLRRILVKDRPLVCINLTFDMHGNCGIKYTPGKVVAVKGTERLIWSDGIFNPNRTIVLSSFGQLVPGMNHNNITFYGIFFPEDYSLDLLLNSANRLYYNMLNYKQALENTINTVSGLLEEQKLSIQAKKKIERYRIYKRFIKFGGDWLKRPYHNAKNDSEFNRWKLYGERKVDLERRRAYKLFNNIIKKDTFKIKYPKLHKKYIDVTTVESKVLKKDKWKV